MAANWLPSIYWIISQKFIHVPVEVLLITPPFTQLNTPYPATAYLKGFFNRKGIASAQADLGIEVILELFSNRGLEKLFDAISQNGTEWNDNINRILGLRNEYFQSIDATISFLQSKNPSLAHRIAARNFLPEAGRFEQLQELEWAFGSMGVQDKAKHIATLYLEDLADLIRETIDPYFGFSRYAERLGRSAATFTELNEALAKPTGLVDGILLEKLDEHLQQHQPKLVAISVPFPGNLFAAFRVAQWIRKNHPNIKTAMGGGFPNTELRSLSDPKVFDYFDFITLDDGEAPLEILLQYIRGEVGADFLKRCFLRRNNEVVYLDSSTGKDYRQSEVGVPDYEGLPIHHYISALEIANPMHRLWSDGRWNKLTMAHGCYWGKCTFCDISLDYIQRYEPLTAALLCDKMEEMIHKTGENGFHFVDEAAPPSLMKELAIELINRKMVVSWWANIRFEKSFSRDLCLLLKASGCIAVSGGLEVASDRLLALIQKGITVAQVARVARNFTEAGIMVHAYLMYGFPTQTPQETIDSLEMIRQLFKAGVLQSAFWHLFTMTAHSPVGLEPAKFGVKRLTDTVGRFANNDLVHEDPQGDQERFGRGFGNHYSITCMAWVWKNLWENGLNSRCLKPLWHPIRCFGIWEKKSYRPQSQQQKFFGKAGCYRSNHLPKPKKGIAVK